MITISVEKEYELRLDIEKRIVYEKFIGMCTKEVVSNMDNNYRTKILPHLQGKSWAKYCDMRNYQLANSQNEINSFVQFCADSGMTHAALIVESMIVKMQMNRLGNNVGVHPVAFTDEQEAKDYLKQNGY